MLQALVEGRTAKATAHALRISVKTVEGHRRSLYRKLGVANRAEAIRRALNEPNVMGMIGPGTDD